MGRQDTPSEYLVSLEEDMSLRGQLSITLYQAANKTARLYRSLLEPYGLTFPQYQALVALWDRGTTNVGDLCAALDLETSTLTPVLKRLEALGYVLRFRDRVDERRVIVALTDKGREFRIEAAAIRRRLLEVTQASPTDMADLRRRLQSLCVIIDRVNSADLRPGQREQAGD